MCHNRLATTDKEVRRMRRPDIILILADDLGFSDLGCFGGEIPTPNLDRLGRDGVRMSQFYNTARCSPSRASLLTGKHPHQTGIGVLTRPDLPHGYAGDLSPQVPTIAELLAEAGWVTWLSGKWHLSADTAHPNDSWPTRRGFERFFGTLAGCGSYYAPQSLHRGETPADDAAAPDFYYTDAISDQAVEWIDGHEDLDTPFFLYLAYTAPHWPLHARESDIDATRGRYSAGWDEVRRQRLERLVSEGVLPAGTSLSERDPSQPDWDAEPEKDWQSSRMEVYAAQVHALDRGVGRVLDALERTGRLDDALIVFLADNGGSAEELPIGPMETFILKDQVMTEGTRTGHSVRIGNTPDITPGPEDTYTSYGVPWANVSNSPFRRYKRWVHEGGIATPFIAHWPSGGIDGTRVIDEPFQLVHVLPTILDAAGIQPERFEPEAPSMLSVLRGEHVEHEDETLYWEHIGNAAVRRGRYKLVRAYPGPWELYDLEVDRVEAHDRAGELPDTVAELSAAWNAWAHRVGVIDWDGMLAHYDAVGAPRFTAEE
jgi:arylsulfatase A-like enzyme